MPSADDIHVHMKASAESLRNAGCLHCMGGVLHVAETSSVQLSCFAKNTCDAGSKLKENAGVAVNR